MATNSKRESIILYNISLLESLDSIKTIVRVKQNYSGLEQFTDPQFNIAAVVAGFPVPNEKASSMRGGDVDKIISSLTIMNIVYGRDRVDPDVLASNLADDVWAKLYSDQTFGGLVIDMRLAFDSEPQFWEPYVALQVNCTVRYVHGIGGI